MELKWIIFSMVALGLIVYGSLSVAFGSDSSLINPPNTTVTDNSTVVIENGVQKVSLRATSAGTYSPAMIAVKKNIPVEISFTADPRSGCGQQLVMKDFGVNVIVNAGETEIISFTPKNTGSFEYACGMRMFRGQLIVTE